MRLPKLVKALPVMRSHFRNASTGRRRLPTCRCHYLKKPGLVVIEGETHIPRKVRHPGIAWGELNRIMALEPRPVRPPKECSGDIRKDLSLVSPGFGSS